MRNIFIVTLQYIFEVQKFKSTVYIKRNLSDIFDKIRHYIKRTIVFKYLLITLNQ